MISLATTRLRAFWPEGDDLTLLGRWCVPTEELWTLRADRYRIAPYPWDDRARFLAAAEFIDTLGEQWLPPLAEALDRHHGMSGGLRYWRIIVGPWLSWYLEALYDRYTCLRDVIDRDGGTGAVRTIGLDAADFVVPATMADFTRLYVEDPYNLQLYTRLLLGMGVTMPRRPLPVEGRMVAAEPAPRDVRSMVRRVSAWRNRHRDVAIIGGPMSGAEHRAWPGWSRGRIGGVLALPAVPTTTRVSATARAALRVSLPCGEGFAAIAASMLAEDLPTAYLEGFVPAPPPRSRVLVSGTAWVADEQFKRLAAAGQAAGARLVAVQHGGYYGMLAAHSPERHEARVADDYVTAGWTAPLAPAARMTPLPLPSIGRARPSAAQDDMLLFVTTMHPRYLYRLQSHHVGSQWADYLDWALRFVAATVPDVRRRLHVRLYPFDFGWDVARAWRTAHPDVVARPASGDASAAMARARLVVIDHPATALLEAIASDHPAVCFWDPGRFEMRPTAQAACNTLRDAGVLFDTPESAAAALTAVVSDPAAWWRDTARQRVLEAFRRQYAQTSPDWMPAWRAHLLSMTEGGAA